MPDNRAKILVIDDHPDVLSLLQDLLAEDGRYDVLGASAIDQALEQFRRHSIQLAITDLRLNRENGFELMRRLHAEAPWLPVIVMTAYGSVDTAVEAIQRGAFDYVEKPFHSEKVLLTVARAVETCNLRTQVDRLRADLQKESSYRRIVARSAPMRAIFELIERLKSSDVNVLIGGPSGTGKELVARAIHESSTRAERPFVTLNCSAIPETLLEGELFGYKKGAFTDAKADKKGLLSEAEGGTFFLDELADLPLSLQPKLLRAIQQREIRPLGSTQSQTLNVRLIAATNQDLKAMIAEKRFREDLFYRLNVVNIDLPPLHRRREDIPLLVTHFLEKMSARFGRPLKGVEESALRRMLNYAWPGNVRELENTMERAAALAEGEWIRSEDLNLPQDAGFDSDGNADRESPPWLRDAAVPPSLQEMEREYILWVLRKAEGNRSLAAKILGIDRKTLYNKLAEYRVSESA